MIALGGSRPWLVAAMIPLVVAGAGCSTTPSTTTPLTPAERTGAPPTASARATDAAGLGPSTGDRPAVRDGDITDVEELAGLVGAGATGDPEWIAVLAELRARSWLISRYPGRYDVVEVYSQEWAAETALPNERESLELGVYLDEPLPKLISVEATRELGELTELEVVLEGGPALIRQLSDDRVRGELPGGRSRGLFTVGRDGPRGRWRIHSVVELRPLDERDTEESNP